MKPEITLTELLNQIKMAIEEKELAEKARVRSEEKRRKANCRYNLLMDAFRAKEYTI